MKKTDLYIVLEGLDGTGKSTLFENLKPLFIREQISFETLCPTQIISTSSFAERFYSSNKKFRKIKLCRIMIFAYRSFKSSKQINWNTDLIIGDRSIVVSYIKNWRKILNSALLTVFIFNILEPFIKAPDFVLLLNAPEDVLLKRLSEKEKIDIDGTPENLKLMKKAYKEVRFSYKISRLKRTKWIDIDSDTTKILLTNEVFIIIKSLLNETKKFKQ